MLRGAVWCDVVRGERCVVRAACCVLRDTMPWVVGLFAFESVHLCMLMLVSLRRRLRG